MGNENWLIIANEKKELGDVLKINEKTLQYGLSLTKEESIALVKNQHEILAEERRVEFGVGILEKLIYTFADSPYIRQEEYVETINSLQEIFYEYKNEFADELNDDELLEIMKQSFDGPCFGSLEKLEKDVLPEYVRQVKESGINSFIRERGLSVDVGEVEIPDDFPYSFDELLEITAELAKGYTYNESTSIPYETAVQLMNAVCYIINEYLETGTGEESGYELGDSLPDARTAYDTGMIIARKKAQTTQHIYNNLIGSFNAYGNENYYDTVAKAIPGFFLYYDLKYSPQNTIITMDYPTILPMPNTMSGIDAMYEYVRRIELEQRFLKEMPADYIVKILQRFDMGYEEQFFNIAVIMLRHFLSMMITGKGMDGKVCDEDYVKLFGIVQSMDMDKLAEYFEKLLKYLIKGRYKADKEMYDYLKGDCRELAALLKAADSPTSLKNIVIL